jgi:leucyl aminopeptidase
MFAPIQAAKAAINITLLSTETLSAWLCQQPAPIQNWLSTVNFSAKPEQMSFVPDAEGKLSQVLLGVDSKNSLWCLAGLPQSLPTGYYQIHDPQQLIKLNLAALGWGLGFYQFTRYKKSTRSNQPVLCLPESVLSSVQLQVNAIGWVRDLINTPAEDMGPDALAAEAKMLAAEFSAEYHEIVGEQLLQQNYPAIYAVGRASHKAPRLVDIRWGKSDAPKITLVGKGVCFDSGGLDIKPASAMAIMKKDMGGAAQVLGLAKLIMANNLPIRLRVLMPMVENAIAGNAFRPGDVVCTRKGLNIEVGNTDAEGRVILSDALTEAVTDKPELLVDFATLTGAARVALGGELPALYGNAEPVIQELKRHCQEQSDPLWHMPLYSPYQRFIESKIADISNDSSSGLGGSITAALFLQNFVDNIPWLHIDLSAWNYGGRPGRAEGGEAMGIRAVFAYLQQRYGG